MYGPHRPGSARLATKTLGIRLISLSFPCISLLTQLFKIFEGFENDSQKHDNLIRFFYSLEMQIFGKNLHLNLTFVLCIMTFLLCSCKSSYKCCDQLNNATVNTDCTCSDQMGGIGTCICTNLPNTRSSWLCKKDSNGDMLRGLKKNHV